MAFCTAGIMPGPPKMWLPVSMGAQGGTAWALLDLGSSSECGCKVVSGAVWVFSSTFQNKYAETRVGFQFYPLAVHSSL